MKQQMAPESAIAEYAGGLTELWAEWEPWLHRAELLLQDGGESLQDVDDPEELLRQVQYHAHTSGELAEGLQPPLAALDAHQYLLASLQACRDTLGAIAMRAEIDELDEQTAEFGVHAVASTRDAFQAARYSTWAANAFSESLGPMLLPVPTSAPSRLGVAIWILTAVCAVLFTVLVFEIMLLTA